MVQWVKVPPTKPDEQSLTLGPTWEKEGSRSHKVLASHVNRQTRDRWKRICDSTLHVPTYRKNSRKVAELICHTDSIHQELRKEHANIWLTSVSLTIFLKCAKFIWENCVRRIRSRMLSALGSGKVSVFLWGRGGRHGERSKYKQMHLETATAALRMQLCLADPIQWNGWEVPKVKRLKELLSEENTQV